MMEKIKGLDKRVIIAGVALIAILIMAIVVLMPKDSKMSNIIDPYEIVEKLEKRGYSVSILEGEELEDMFKESMPIEIIEKIDLVFGTMNMETEEMGTFFCFSDEKIVEEFEKSIKDWLKQMSAAGDALPVEVKRTGLIVYMGSSRIWKDAQ